MSYPYTNPYNPFSVHSPVVGMHVENHDFEFAFAEAEKRVSETPDDDHIAYSYHLNNRGYLHLQLGRYEEAVADCFEARSKNPNLDQNNLMLARLFQKHYQSLIVPAMDHLKQELHPDAFSQVAYAYYDTGFYAQAANYFNLAIRAAGTAGAPEHHNSLAACYLRSGLPIEAVRESKKAMRMDGSTDPTNYKLAARLLEKAGLDPSEFIEGVKLGAQMEEPGSEGDDSQEMLYYTHQDDESLVARLSDVISEMEGSDAQDDDDHAFMLAGYLNHRAFTYINTNQVNKAVDDCLRARDLNPYLNHSNLRLAQFLEVHYDSLLKPQFNRLEEEISAEVYQEIGMIYFAYKFYTNAAYYFRLAAHMAEGLLQADAYNDLAGAYYNAGFTIDALYASEKAISLNPNISKANNNLSRSKLKLSGFIQLFD